MVETEIPEKKLGVTDAVVLQQLLEMTLMGLCS